MGNKISMFKIAPELNTALDSFISDLEKLGYNNIGLDQFRECLVNWNSGDANTTAAIWVGRSGLSFANKIKVYEENIKKLIALATDYKNAVNFMIAYENELANDKSDSAQIILDNYLKEIDSIINQSTTGYYEEHINPIVYNKFVFCKNDITSEINSFEVEKNNLLNVRTYELRNCLYSNERVNTIVNNLLRKKDRIDIYVTDLFKRLTDINYRLENFSSYLKGRNSLDGIFNMKVSALYGNKFVTATSHFEDIVGPEHSQGAPGEKNKEPEKFIVDLKPGDEGLLDLDFIDYARLSRTAASALNGQNNELIDNVDGWIPESFISKQWWGYHTNGVIRYKVRDDGTVLFYDWNERDKEWKSMAFTSVEVLTKSLEEQGWIDEPRWDTPLADIKEERRQAAAERATEEKKAEENKPKVIWPDEYTTDSSTPKQRLEKRKQKANEMGITYEEYMDQYYRSKYENNKEVTEPFNSYEEYMYDHYRNMKLYQSEPLWSDLSMSEAIEARKNRAEELGLTFKEYMKAYYIDKFETDKEVTDVYNTYQEYIDAHYETLAEHVGIPKESVPDAIKKAEEMGMTYEEYIVSLWNQQSKS